VVSAIHQIGIAVPIIASNHDTMTSYDIVM